MTRNAIDATFSQTRAEGRPALMPYITVGFPDLESTADIAVTTLEAGADMLELGVPFSDPLMDGPAIQHAQQVALDMGVTPQTCLQVARQISARSSKPFVFMGAYNPILAYGLERFSLDAAEAGASGLIVPDVPLEEQGELRAAAEGAGLHVIQMVAPTSTEARVERACRYASGFIYSMSVSGVTGARSSVVETARPLVERVRRCTDVPIAVGFGIAGPEQAREVAPFADGIAVGSAFITLLRDTPAAGRHRAITAFISSLRDALGSAASPV